MEQHTFMFIAWIATVICVRFVTIITEKKLEDAWRPQFYGWLALFFYIFATIFVIRANPAEQAHPEMLTMSLMIVTLMCGINHLLRVFFEPMIHAFISIRRRNKETP